MTNVALPPIFAKTRFTLPEKLRPGVVFHVSREMDEEAYALAQKLDGQNTRSEHFGCWWVECDNLGILATIVGDTAYALHVHGRRSGRQSPFVFDTAALHDPTWNDMADWQKVAAGTYIRASILFAEYTRREAEMSVNTQTRNRPCAFARDGDTLRYIPLDRLSSASGQHRQRGYERPSEPSGIRMREHDVRGHWRTYSTGARVWVRSHKRGDAALGRVDRVIGRGIRQ